METFPAVADKTHIAPPWVLTAAQLAAAAPLFAVKQPVPVMDGWLGLPFRPRALTIESRPSNGSWPLTSPISAPSGEVIVDVLGISESGGTYYRRFGLNQYQPAVIPCEFLRNAQVRALKNAGADRDLVVVATNGYPPSTGIPMILAETYTVAGTYLVPPGATGFTAGTADPGFSWATTNDDGLAAAVPAPTVVGVIQTVAGSRFTTTVAPVTLVWRIFP